MGLVTVSKDEKRGIKVRSDRSSEELGFTEIPTWRHEPDRNSWAGTIDISPVTMMSLTQQAYLAKSSEEVVIEPEAMDIIKKQCSTMRKPRLFLDAEGTVLSDAPHTPLWDTLFRKVSAFNRSGGLRSVGLPHLRDVVSLNEQLPAPFRLGIDDEVEALLTHPLPAPYDGTDESLRNIPLSSLDYIKADVQSMAARRASKKTLEEKFGSMGITNLHELLVNPPYRYIDRSNPQNIRELLPGEKGTVLGTISAIRQKSEKLTVITVKDGNGTTIDCSYFNVGRWFINRYHEGDEVILNGAYKPFYGRNGVEYPGMQYPDIDFADVGSLPIIPVYHQSGKNGVTTAMMMSAERELVERMGDFTGDAWLEKAVKEAKTGIEHPLPYGTALMRMHEPHTMEELTDASDSLAFTELVRMMTIIEDERKSQKPLVGMEQTPDGSLTDAYIDSLPYSLTGAQSRVLEKIDTGMRKKEPFHSLLVGDVGSGKTTVIHLAALKSVEAGHQAVICAPTEILAVQLYDVFIELLKKMPVSAQERIHPVLHAHYKGKGSTERRKANRAAIKDGTANIVFGTHSVFSKTVTWHDLSFVGIDEQHKFGAQQRSVLLDVRSDGRIPDMLMQTATPIPRSMAQVYYGDISYLRLDELPQGRLPIETKWVKMKGGELLEDAANPIWHDIQGEAFIGHGTFIVCPMVEDSPRLSAASVKKSYERIREILGARVKTAMVYGSQDKEEQAKAIEDFRTGAVQVLVASSVVEVGVSCEEATRMVVLDASRFGLASLHQIRGRIGRGSLASTCYLVTRTFNPDAERRMQAMTETLDGWTLSQTDLKNRGAGTVFGSTQSGGTDFVFADLVANGQWIPEARRIATEVLASPIAAQALEDSRRWFGVEKGDSILS